MLFNYNDARDKLAGYMAEVEYYNDEYLDEQYEMIESINNAVEKIIKEHVPKIIAKQEPESMALLVSEIMGFDLSRNTKSHDIGFDLRFGYISSPASFTCQIDLAKEIYFGAQKEDDPEKYFQDVGAYLANCLNDAKARHEGQS